MQIHDTSILEYLFSLYYTPCVKPAGHSQEFKARSESRYFPCQIAFSQFFVKPSFENPGGGNRTTSPYIVDCFSPFLTQLQTYCNTIKTLFLKQGA